MIYKKELTGLKLKRDLNLMRANQRWHNKNKSGGNFGYNLFSDPGVSRTNFELTGAYNTKGEITSLRFGRIWQAGTPIENLQLYVYPDLITNLRKRMEYMQQFDKGLA